MGMFQLCRPQLLTQIAPNLRARRQLRVTQLFRIVTSLKSDVALVSTMMPA
jgi:hypothetical protein